MKKLKRDDAYNATDADEYEMTMAIEHNVDDDEIFYLCDSNIETIEYEWLSIASNSILSSLVSYQCDSSGWWLQDGLWIDAVVVAFCEILFELLTLNEWTIGRWLMHNGMNLNLFAIPIKYLMPVAWGVGKLILLLFKLDWTLQAML